MTDDATGLRVQPQMVTGEDIAALKETGEMRREERPDLRRRAIGKDGSGQSPHGRTKLETPRASYER